MPLLVTVEASTFARGASVHLEGIGTMNISTELLDVPIRHFQNFGLQGGLGCWFLGGIFCSLYLLNAASSSVVCRSSGLQRSFVVLGSS